MAPAIHRARRALSATLFLLLPLVLVAPSLAAEQPPLPESIRDAIERAGDNRDEIVAAWNQVPRDQSAGMEFLIKYMPERDLTSLTTEYLLENVDYAYRAWRSAPWHEQVSEELFLNEVLPYASINERRDQWRKDFYDRFHPLVAEAKTPGEAAALLNQHVFNQVKVHYSTKRPKADQSPYESIDAGMASCTGLSILLIDACRAVGVPARFVGIPMWTDGSGNHSWVEVWDDGWHFTGADEATGLDLDKAWFVDRAAQARADEPRHSIYAVSYRHTPTRFPLVWRRAGDYVRAVNVTERYLKQGSAVPADHFAVMFRVLQGKSGDRCAANFRIRNSAGDVVFQGQTKDERFDANDHLTVPLPKDETFQVEIVDGDDVHVTQIKADHADQLVTLETSNAAAALREDAAGESPTDTLQQLAAYLAQPRASRGPIAEQAFASKPLSASDAAAAQTQLWNDHVRFIEQQRRAEFDNNEIKL
ncbi:MAG: transglutaminase domain-containing protein, partial [Planctomycetales bacterium]|nr:transglutaminase domain-containing protein [Planctomycetales bacterium]